MFKFHKSYFNIKDVKKKIPGIRGKLQLKNAIKSNYQGGQGKVFKKLLLKKEIKKVPNIKIMKILAQALCDGQLFQNL